MIAAWIIYECRMTIEKKSYSWMENFFVCLFVCLSVHLWQEEKFSGKKLFGNFFLFYRKGQTRINCIQPKNRKKKLILMQKLNFHFQIIHLRSLKMQRIFFFIFISGTFFHQIPFINNFNRFLSVCLFVCFEFIIFSHSFKIFSWLSHHHHCCCYDTSTHTLDD